MSSHHIYPRWVFGPNYKTKETHPTLCNEVTGLLCRDCHDQMEELNRELESMILRPFQLCFRKAYNEFMRGEVSSDTLFAIVMVGFIKVFTRSIGSYSTNIRFWLTLRVRNPGVSLRKKDRQ